MIEFELAEPIEQDSLIHCRYQPHDSTLVLYVPETLTSLDFAAFLQFVTNPYTHSLIRIGSRTCSVAPLKPDQTIDKIKFIPLTSQIQKSSETDQIQ